MKLEETILTNFRQYRGEHRAKFADLPDKNVTVINGVMGAGKSNLFNAINWCLYGNRPEDEDAERPIINKAELESVEPGKRVIAKVQVKFRHRGERYVMRREVGATKRSNKKGDWTEDYTPEPYLAKITGTGETKRLENPSVTINSILPENVRPYFFFDGEKIDQFVRPGHEKEVKQAIRDVLQLSVLERARDHLETLAREFQRDWRKKAPNELQKLLVEEENLRNELDEAKKDHSKKRSELGAAKKVIAGLSDTLKKRDKVRHLVEQRDDLNNRIDELNKERDHVVLKMKGEASLAYIKFGEGIFQQSLAIIDQKRTRGEIPSGIRERFLQDLMELHKCICGREIHPGSPEERALKERLNLTIPSELEDILLRMNGELTYINNRRRHLIENLKEQLRKKDEIEQKAEGFQIKLAEVKAHLKGDEGEDIATLEKKFEEEESRRDQINADIGSLQEKINELENKLQQKQTQIEQEHKKVTSASFLYNKADLARKSADALNEILEVFAQERREEIQQKAREIFDNFGWKTGQFLKVSITKDYELEVYDRWGLPARKELSAGERECFSLAFIVAMANIAAVASIGEAEAPFMMDTPFARISSGPRANIAKTLPQLVPQLVLFVTDVELTDEARANLNRRIGAEYNLIFDVSTGSTHIEEVN